jgi:hypothetical protein
MAQLHPAEGRAGLSHLEEITAQCRAGNMARRNLNVQPISSCRRADRLPVEPQARRRKIHSV